MTTGKSRPDVPLSSLQLGKPLGKGGEGEVFTVANRPGEVFKRYYRKTANAKSLRALADFPRSLDEHEQGLLLTQTAWPLACVTDGATVAGFLMKQVPASFFGRTEAGDKLRELQYLLYPPRPMWRSITPLGSTGRLQIARDFVLLMRILHEHSMVLGDISLRNFLWRPGEPAGIFILDCDSARGAGLPSVLPGAPQTPDWEDPKMPATGPDADTDCYKVALVVGRLLAAKPNVRPGAPLSPLPGIQQNIADPLRVCFSEAAGPHGMRPNLSRWAQVLSGRETIPVNLPAPLPPPPLIPQAEMDGRGPRETQQVRPIGNPS